jgi:hypothetical protein
MMIGVMITVLVALVLLTFFGVIRLKHTEPSLTWGRPCVFLRYTDSQEASIDPL